jgi:hypothetical protein
MYNGEFEQVIDITIECNDHDDCLKITNNIKKQCDAWFYNVSYQEGKSARKGPVLKRSLTVQQKGYASDIIIFKEALHRVCEQMNIMTQSEYVTFKYRFAYPTETLNEKP